jgi:hypothetical protein
MRGLAAPLRSCVDPGMAAPEPNSPEAKRVAQKVRNVFYMIAAANLVIIAIVMWPRPKLPPRAKSTAENSPASSVPGQTVPLHELEAVHERLLDAYRGRDAAKFAELFSAAADPRVDEEYFRTVVIGRYREEFGDIRGKTLAIETKSDPSGGVLVYEFTSQKGPRGKSHARFRREDGRMRILQWRLERF